MPSDPDSSAPLRFNSTRGRNINPRVTWLDLNASGLHAEAWNSDDLTKRIKNKFGFSVPCSIKLKPTPEHEEETYFDQLSVSGPTRPHSLTTYNPGWSKKRQWPQLSL